MSATAEDVDGLVNDLVESLMLVAGSSYCSRGNLLMISSRLHEGQRSGDRVSSAPSRVVGLGWLRAILCTDSQAFAGHFQVVHPYSLRPTRR